MCVIEEALQTRTSAKRIGHAIPIQVDEADFWVSEVEARGYSIGLERAPVPESVEAEREIAGEGRGRHQKVRTPVSIGIQELDPRLGEFDPSWSQRHASWPVKVTIAPVSPKPDGAIHFQNVGKATPE
jgi:hypothetical protein